MTRPLRIIADDYGLSPGVSAAIRSLLDLDRISGTSCMTIFVDWPEHAAELGGRHSAGLHLTLTDHPALTGRSSLAPGGLMPTAGRLMSGLAVGRIAESDVHAELDAQHQRFAAARPDGPDFYDGHQHVHFLPAVRRWLRKRFEASENAAHRFVRAAPRFKAGVASADRKQAVVAALAAGFDASMRRAGVPLSGALTGIYDWKRSDGFAGAFAAARQRPTPQLFMCHPGFPDEALAARDPFVAQRQVEYDLLRASDHIALLDPRPLARATNSA